MASGHIAQVGKGVLMQNTKKTSEKSPDWKGTLMLSEDYKAGQTVKIAGWLLVLFHSVACCLRLARFNLGSKTNNEKWRENFFTGVPSPAGAGILLLPLILSLSDFSSNFDYKKLAIIFIIASTFLMISKIPTYSLKGIKVSRPFLIFLLLLIAVYFGSLINYPFNTLLATGFLYLSLIPISFVHFKIIKKRSSKASDSLISEDFI